MLVGLKHGVRFTFCRTLKKALENDSAEVRYQQQDTVTIVSGSYQINNLQALWIFKGEQNSIGVHNTSKS
jgi:hypothetical protein